jgi:hypothetical protein
MRGKAEKSAIVTIVLRIRLITNTGGKYLLSCYICQLHPDSGDYRFHIFSKPGFKYYKVTTLCFLIKSGSMLTPIPGPVGTLIFPSETFRGDVGHSNITEVPSPLNS